jgi:release factor glutamine methyltransferase
LESINTRELYNLTAGRFRKEGIPEADLEAELLLRSFLGLDRAGLFLDERRFAGNELAKFEKLVVRRLAREPLAYITGEKEFWSLSFKVSPDVLIPRPETELLVEKVLDLIKETGKFSGRILDLGTGSGIVAAALASELPEAEIVAVDSSSAVLEVASENIARHGFSERVTMVEGDWFGPLRPNHQFDIIVSNPPYVAESTCDNLQPELDFEPRKALFAGIDGLDAYRRMVPEAGNYLKTGGFLLFEIGAEQEMLIKEIFSAVPDLKLLEIFADHAGHARVAVVCPFEGV